MTFVFILPHILRSAQDRLAFHRKKKTCVQTERDIKKKLGEWGGVIDAHIFLQQYSLSQSDSLTASIEFYVLLPLFTASTLNSQVSGLSGSMKEDDQSLAKHGILGMCHKGVMIATQ